MAEDEIQNDTIDIGPPGKISYKDIIIGQFLKISVFCNVEFRGGYWTRMTTKDGGSKLVYNQDTRDIFCNSVNALGILLLPRFDTDMTKSSKRHKIRLRILQKAFMDKSEVDEKIILGEGFYQTPEDKINLEEYRQKRLNLFLELFTELSKLLSRENYLELAGGTF